jgi:hypothetical protein
MPELSIFGVLKRFTLTNTDDPNHAARRRRIYAYLWYRHRKLANLHLPLNRIRSFRRIKLEQHYLCRNLVTW